MKVIRDFSLFTISAKDGEQLTDEKDAAAFDNVEKGEPLNPKGAPEATPTAAGAANQQPAGAAGSATKATEENEEKKSNGAHTPV